MLCSIQEQQLLLQQQQQQQHRVTQCEVWACDSSYVLSDRERKAAGVGDGSATDNHDAVTFLKQVPLQGCCPPLRIHVRRRISCGQFRALI
jgi:hypothetical protein